MKKIILVLLIVGSGITVAQNTGVKVSTLCGTIAGVENGPFASARFNYPVEIAYNSDGNKLYIFDNENTNLLRVVDISGRQVSEAVRLDGGVFGGRITSIMMSKNNDTLFIARDKWIDPPSDAVGVFTLTKNGNFADPVKYSGAYTCNVLAVNPVTGELFGNSFVGAKVLRMNKSPKEDEFMFTVGTEGADEFRMTWSRDGKTLYTASYYNGAVWRSTYDTDTRQFVGVPEPYVGTYKQKGALEGYRTEARINAPSNMATDNNGNLFICDRANRVVWKVDVDGNVKILAGQVGIAGSTDGDGNNALFDTPEAITIDCNNDIIYVVDQGNSKIRKIVSNSLSLKLPNIFTSNMVLQQNSQTALWGWSTPNDDIQITGSWGATATTKAGTDGKWNTKIQTPKALAGQAIPYTLTFKGTVKTIVLNNVLIGDVWLCSGQSNMEFTMNPLPWTPGVKNYATEIAAANYPNIRLFKVPGNVQTEVADNCDGTWLECNPTNVASFSGVAYYFGRELNQNSEINIPIGLLLTAYGGSSCQAWISREVLAADAEFNTKILVPYDAAPTALIPPTRPTNLYNGMVAPLIPFGIKGALWYQGESNSWDGAFYTKLCSAMFQDWRTKWGLGDFPFYFVQLPAFIDTSWPTFRDAQTNILLAPNTGMAVTIDIVASDPSNVHPENKIEVGQRLAKWAMAKDYGQKIVFSGPIYKSNVVQGNKMIISFHSATIGTGLLSKDGTALKGFQICGSNGTFYTAVANIVGNTVEVSSTSVAVPTVVQYAYLSNPVVNLINKEGLPAAPFKTSTWNNSIVISSPVSTNLENIYNTDITVYKNANNRIAIHFNEEMKAGFLVEVYTIMGQKIVCKQLVNNNEIIDSVLPSGLYLITLTRNGQVITKKVILN